MANTHRTIIVPAGMVEAARQLGKEIAPGGHGMFTTELSPTGNPPATHYVSSGLIDEGFATVLNDGLMLHAAAQAGAAKQDLPKQATQPDAVNLVGNALVGNGKHTKTVDGQEVEVDEGPHEMFARLGLKIINPTAI